MNLTTLLAVVGLLACGWFVVAYQVTTGGDWRHSAAGRHLMTFTATLGLLFGLIMLGRAWPDYPGRSVVVPLALAALVVLLVRRCVLLHTAQHPREPSGRRTERA